MQQPALVRLLNNLWRQGADNQRASDPERPAATRARSARGLVRRGGHAEVRLGRQSERAGGWAVAPWRGRNSRWAEQDGMMWQVVWTMLYPAERLPGAQRVACAVFSSFQQARARRAIRRPIYELRV